MVDKRLCCPPYHRCNRQFTIQKIYNYAKLYRRFRWCLQSDV